MEITTAILNVDNYLQGSDAYTNRAWNEIRAYIAEVQKPAHNNARDEICEMIAEVCAHDSLNCRGDKSKCRFTTSQTSPVA